jgi:hypothetical protein
MESRPEPVKQNTRHKKQKKTKTQNEEFDTAQDLCFFVRTIQHTIDTDFTAHIRWSKLKGVRHELMLSPTQKHKNITKTYTLQKL